MIAQILTYWLLAQACGLVGLALSWRLLHGLPDRGYGFAKTLGLLVTGYLAWVLAMLGLAPFGAGLLVGCALFVGVGGLLAARTELGELGRWLAARWRLIAFYELLFAAALVFLAVQRSYEFGFVGPNPWGTERPMDFALFNAIRVSGLFPPHDPWMAGFAINYYYFGYLLMAAVSLLSGLAPSVAYNLSLALIYALTALGVASVVVNLCELTRRQLAPRHDAFATGLAAVLATVLVLLGGNQGGALQILSGTPMILALDGGDMARALANGLGARAPLTLGQPFHGADFDGTTTITPVDMVKDFNWWNPSRALWDSFPAPEGPPSPPYRAYTITEFPAFSFWLGDMHPHVMALPFGLLAIGLALHTAARPLLPEFGRTRTGWSELVLAGIVLGSLYVINSWDFPTYLLLFLGALLLLHVRNSERGWSLGRRGWLAYGVQALGLAGCSIMLFLPFFLTFKSLVGGREPLVDIPVLGAITRTLGVVSWSHTPLQTFLIIFGLFFIPLLAFVRLAVRQPVHATQPAAGWSAHAILGSVALGALAVGLLLGFPLLALLPIGLLAALGALRLARAGRVGEAFALWAFALGCMVCFGTEVIYLRDVFDNRMNTIFKFYYQLWLMWGTLAAYALWWLLVGAPQRLHARRPAVSAESREPDMQADGGDGHIARQANLVAYPWSAAAVLIVFVPLLAGALIYPWFTTGKALTEGTWVGLHGTTPRERSPDGAAAIAWLRATVPGDAVIVEAVSPLPTFGYDTEGLGLAGVSSSTGLATVMGWTSHQQQWRGGDPAAYAQIDTRRVDVLSIYSSPDAVQARDLLHKYGVRYIYVGPTERALYPPEGIAKLSELGTVAFQQGDVTIIEVK